MSLSSRIDRPSPGIPLSISEVDSSHDSTDSAECYSTPNLSRRPKNNGLIPLKDFKESLENEKNIRKYLTKFESLQVPNSLRNGKIIEVLEKNYKLQVQTLLEEVNQLKLDKKILEKKMERVQKGSTASPGRSRTDFALDSIVDDSMVRKTLDAKNSTIKELEFQLAQSNKENSNLRMRLDAMAKQMEDFVQRIADSENAQEMLREKDEEIMNLRSNLEAEELRQDKFLKELSYLRNENIALKLKSQCPNCGQPPTGTTSFTNPPFHCNSKEQSFYSSEKYDHQRTGSEGRFIGKILNLSEINDDQKFGGGGGGGSPSHGSIRFRPFLTSRTRDSADDDTERLKNEVGQLQNLSMKVLSEYEKGLKKEKSLDTRRDSKTLDRIIEVNKIKSYMIEAQNKKLLSILNNGRESGSKSYRGPGVKY